MKTKLTVSIDKELISQAKQCAREQGLSLSQIIETALGGMSYSDRPSFSARWRGQFQPAKEKDMRYQHLAKKMFIIILIDTDVLIDVALDRRPHSTASWNLLDALEQQKGIAYAAWHSLSNFYNVVSPAKGADHT